MQHQNWRYGFVPSGILCQVEQGIVELDFDFRRRGDRGGGQRLLPGWLRRLADLDSRGRTALAAQAHVAGPDDRFQVGDQSLVVTNRQRSPRLVDGPAHEFQPDDLEEEVEVTGPDPDGAEQSLEVPGLVNPLVQAHDDARVQLGGALLEGDDPADDQLGGARGGDRASP